MTSRSVHGPHSTLFSVSRYVYVFKDKNMDLVLLIYKDFQFSYLRAAEMYEDLRTFGIKQKDCNHCNSLFVLFQMTLNTVFPHIVSAETILF